MTLQHVKRFCCFAIIFLKMYPQRCVHIFKKAPFRDHCPEKPGPCKSKAGLQPQNSGSNPRTQVPTPETELLPVPKSLKSLPAQKIPVPL